MKKFLKIWKIEIGIASAIVLVLIIWHLPYCFVSWDNLIEKINEGKLENKTIAYEEYYRLVKDYRATIIQFIAGALFLAGMIIANRRARAMEDNAKAANDQVIATKQRNIVDQYFKAVEQLNNKDTTIKLGAINSLKIIMNSDIEYHNVIIDLLCAYIREKRPLELVVFNDEPVQIIENENTYIENYIPLSEEIITIMTVLGEREKLKNESEINLNKTNWYKANLKQMNFEGFNFNDSSFHLAELWSTNFESCNLNRIDGTNANFEMANLINTKMISAKLQGANFDRTDFMESEIRNADLTNAKIRNSNLSYSDFKYSNLNNASFFGSKICTFNPTIGDIKTIELEDTNLENTNLEDIKELYQDAKDSDSFKISFIMELEKANSVKGIKLDDHMMDIIRKEFPELLKRIEGKE